MNETNRGKPLVLVADDEEHITELLAMALGFNGFEVERASSGRAVALRLSGRRGSGRSWWLARARTIAETAGMSKGLIPYYFGTKENLFRECVAWDIPIDALTSEGQEESAQRYVSTMLRMWEADPHSPMAVLLRPAEIGLTGRGPYSTRRQSCREPP